MIISNKVRKEASMNCVSILRGLVVASFISTTFGCASIVSDSVYPVEITSTPSGANFEIKNQAGQVVQTGSTPGYARLEAGAGYFDGEFYTVTYQKQGFETQAVPLDTEVDNWYGWGNLFFGGLLGYFVVDPLTGAMYELPPRVHAGLRSDPTAAAGLVGGGSSGYSPSSYDSSSSSAPRYNVPAPRKSGLTIEQELADLKAQNLPYTEYMARYREITQQ